MDELKARVSEIVLRGESPASGHQDLCALIRDINQFSATTLDLVSIAQLLDLSLQLQDADFNALPEAAKIRESCVALTQHICDLQSEIADRKFAECFEEPDEIDDRRFAEALQAQWAKEGDGTEQVQSGHAEDQSPDDRSTSLLRTTVKEDISTGDDDREHREINSIESSVLRASPPTTPPHQIEKQVEVPQTTGSEPANNRIDQSLDRSSGHQSSRPNTPDTEVACDGSDGGLIKRYHSTRHPRPPISPSASLGRETSNDSPEYFSEEDTDPALERRKRLDDQLAKIEIKYSKIGRAIKPLNERKVALKAQQTVVNRQLKEALRKDPKDGCLTLRADPEKVEDEITKVTKPLEEMLERLRRFQTLEARYREELESLRLRSVDTRSLSESCQSSRSSSASVTEAQRQTPERSIWDMSTDSEGEIDRTDDESPMEVDSNNDILRRIHREAGNRVTNEPSRRPYTGDVMIKDQGLNSSTPQYPSPTKMVDQVTEYLSAHSLQSPVTSSTAETATQRRLLLLRQELEWFSQLKVGAFPADLSSSVTADNAAADEPRLDLAKITREVKHECNESKDIDHDPNHEGQLSPLKLKNLFTRRDRAISRCTTSLDRSPPDVRRSITLPSQVTHAPPESIDSPSFGGKVCRGSSSSYEEKLKSLSHFARSQVESSPTTIDTSTPRLRPFLETYASPLSSSPSQEPRSPPGEHSTLLSNFRTKANLSIAVTATSTLPTPPKTPRSVQSIESDPGDPLFSDLSPPTLCTPKRPRLPILISDNDLLSDLPPPTPCTPKRLPLPILISDNDLLSDLPPSTPCTPKRPRPPTPTESDSDVPITRAKKKKSHHHRDSLAFDSDSDLPIPILQSSTKKRRRRIIRHPNIFKTATTQSSSRDTPHPRIAKYTAFESPH